MTDVGGRSDPEGLQPIERFARVDAGGPSAATDLSPEDAAVPIPGPWRRTVRRMATDKPTMGAAAFLVLLVLVALFADWVAPHGPNVQQVGEAYAGPARDHLLGTDQLGRDTLSRLIFGARASMLTGLQIIVLALAVSVPVGLFSGFRGGHLDNLIMRLMDTLVSVPALVLALAVIGVLGRGLTKIAIALAIVLIPGFVRLIRAQALAVREETFIDASRSLGTRESTILRKRMLPNVASPLIVAVAVASGAVLIAEASLSLLGFGITPPDPSWGSMLNKGYAVIFTHPWQMLVPGMVLAATVLAFNTVGDGLRDALGVGVARNPSFTGKLGLTTAAVQGPARTVEEAPLLSVDGLTVEFHTEAGPVTVVDEVSFSIAPGEVLGLVGESGSGKSVSSLSIMRLVPSPPGRIISGSIMFDRRDLLAASKSEMRAVRGSDIAMVFQDPMTSLNPAYTVGNQLVEVIRRHDGCTRRAARNRAVELLDLVGIPGPPDRMSDYPHQLSGGMRQRVLIAIGLAGRPRLLIADEPTTALDVTVQAQILDLLRTLQKEMHLAVLFVTHDLGVVADLCDRVAVMYAGQIVEQGSVDEVFAAPRHPYTAGLLGAIPQVARTGERLVSISGVVPSPGSMPVGCRFRLRCDHATDSCLDPVVLRRADDRLVRCVRVEALDLDGVE